MDEMVEVALGRARRWLAAVVSQESWAAMVAYRVNLAVESPENRPEIRAVIEVVVAFVSVRRPLDWAPS